VAVFIELTTDSFADTFNKSRNAAQKAKRAGITRARRPLRGLEIKDDTYAIIKVVQADGSEIKLVDSGSPDGYTTQYSNFILQSVQEARMEKHQIVETFGEPYIFFFGESPRFLDVTAVLVDSLDFNWYAEFWENYNRFLRGTKSVEMGARTYLFYDDNIVEGYMLQAQARKTSDQPLMVMLTFRLFLSNYQNVTFVGDPNFPVRSNVNLPPGVDLTTADAYTAGRAAVTAARNEVYHEAERIKAETGGKQQASGFGGGDKLSSALRSGLKSTGDPFIDGIMSNASEALNIEEGGIRTMPLRGKIADNSDEFTALRPPAKPYEPADPLEDLGGDEDGQPDAKSLHQSAAHEAQKYGANIDNPETYNSMGMGPRFTSQPGFGLRGSSGNSASFGVRGGISFGAGVAGGINGGMGFSGLFTTGMSSSMSVSLRGSVSANMSAGVGSGVYGNGVPIQQGVMQGTGVGGGIPGGMSGGMGPGGPGTLTQYQSGGMFAQANGFGSMQGYGQGLSASGPGVSVGGAPSAFSMTSVPGSLVVGGTVQETFFIGPYGVSSTKSSTGIFV
jgi:hypothetical protein